MAIAIALLLAAIAMVEALVVVPGYRAAQARDAAALEAEIGTLMGWLKDREAARQGCTKECDI